MKILFIVCVLLFVGNPVFSQKSECGTPSRQKTEKENKEKDAAAFLPDNGKTYIVPVIFHVLYNTGEENISNERILAVLETMQKDFLRTNPDIWYVPDEFTGKIGNPNIRFVLADKLPNGEATPGIIRKRTSTVEFKYEKSKMFDESPIIAPSKYLNVYICNLNTNGYYPNKTEPKFDGVVMGYWRAGKGVRTLTHEVGHWLDLYHIFEGGCDDEDEVSDTPGQKKHMHTSPDHPLFECQKQAEMFMNFMDYSCSRLFFTEGQVARMRQYIIAKKPSLRSE